MSAPTMAQVLTNAAVTASERQHLANLARLDAGRRRIAHVGDGNTRPTFTATRGENDSWTCTRCRKTVSDPSHAQTCTGVAQ